jgi:hypothetical protein
MALKVPKHLYLLYKTHSNWNQMTWFIAVASGKFLQIKSILAAIAKDSVINIAKIRTLHTM